MGSPSRLAYYTYDALESLVIAGVNLLIRACKTFFLVGFVYFLVSVRVFTQVYAGLKEEAAPQRAFRTGLPGLSNWECTCILHCKDSCENNREIHGYESLLGKDGNRKESRINVDSFQATPRYIYMLFGKIRSAAVRSHSSGTHIINRFASLYLTTGSYGAYWDFQDSSSPTCLSIARTAALGRWCQRIAVNVLIWITYLCYADIP